MARKSVADELLEQVSDKPKTTKTTNKKGGNKVKRINIETVKTVVIAVLVTAIVAFIGGMKYQASYQSSVKAEAKELTTLVPVVSKQ